MQKNVAGQRLYVFAFGDEGHANPGEPVPGLTDITGNVHLDGGAANAIDDVNPTEIAGGWYAFDLTQAETNANEILPVCVSATANVNVIAAPIYTTPASFNSEALATASALATVDDNVDAILVDTAEIGTAGAGLTDLGGMSTAMQAEVQSEANDALVALGLDHLVSAATSGGEVTVDSIVGRLAAASGDFGDFDRTTDSLEAIRARGDAAWLTGGGGSISDIVQWKVLVPQALDLANTKVYRLAIALTNQLDDLPTTGEISPGTISIDRAAQGGTTWSSVVTDAAMSESAGLIYYDEVFDAGTGYESGDMIRITFKGQKITVSANDYEITDGTNGIIAYTGIVADTPDVNVARIAGVSTNVAALNSFLALLNGSGQLQAGTIASNTLQADKFADGFLTSTKVSTGTVTAIQNGLATGTEAAAIQTVVDAIKVVTDALPEGGALTTLLSNIAAILVDTGTTLPASLTGIEDKVDTVDLVADGIKAKTDSLTFTKAGEVDANAQSINGAAVTGDGQTGTEWDAA